MEEKARLSKEKVNAWEVQKNYMSIWKKFVLLSNSMCSVTGTSAVKPDGSDQTECKKYCNLWLSKYIIDQQCGVKMEQMKSMKVLIDSLCGNNSEESIKLNQFIDDFQTFLSQINEVLQEKIENKEDQSQVTALSTKCNDLLDSSLASRIGGAKDKGDGVELYRRLEERQLELSTIVAQFKAEKEAILENSVTEDSLKYVQQAQNSISRLKMSGIEETAIPADVESDLNNLLQLIKADVVIDQETKKGISLENLMNRMEKIKVVLKNTVNLGGKAFLKVFTLILGKLILF